MTKYFTDANFDNLLLFENKVFPRYINMVNTDFLICPKAVTRGALCKKVFLEISQNSQENNYCQSLFFDKVAGLKVSLHIYKFCYNSAVIRIIVIL